MVAAGRKPSGESPRGGKVDHRTACAVPLQIPQPWSALHHPTEFISVVSGPLHYAARVAVLA